MLREFYPPILIGLGGVLAIFAAVVAYDVWAQRKELKPLYGAHWWWRLRW